MRRYVLPLLGAMLLATSQAMAGEHPDRHQVPGPDYGVALTPAVYFVNFLFMYFSNPDTAANMPAYRAPIPSELASCLLQHPEGCRYADYQQYFNGQAQCGDGHRGNTCRWKAQCELNPSFTHLAPPEFDQSNQINEPLGIGRATRLARSLGMDDEMVLTPDQYQCLIGPPASDQLPRIRLSNASRISPIRMETQTLPSPAMGCPCSMIRRSPASLLSEASAHPMRRVFG